MTFNPQITERDGEGRIILRIDPNYDPSMQLLNGKPQNRPKEQQYKQETGWKRYVVCAAVKTADGAVHVGKRHPDCFALIGALGGIKYHLGSVQGFVDNEWRFLTRSEAFKVAKDAGQILEMKKAKAEGRGVLYSEDIY